MIDQFLQMEEINNLFERNIDGFYYWPYLRKNILQKISIKELTNNISIKNNVSLSNLLVFLKESIIKQPIKSLSNKKILIFNHPRKIKNGDFYECMYTEKIASYYDDEVVTAEFPYKFEHFKPASIEGLYYLDYIEFNAQLNSIFYKKKVKNKKEIVFEAKFINQSLKDNLNIFLDVNFLIDLLAKRYVTYFPKKRMLRKFIKQVDPKIVIEIVSYDVNMLIVNEICTELNIPTFELQHGVMGRGHIAYNFNRKSNYSFFPDNLLLFSDFWNETTRIPLSKNNIYSVGFPFLEENLINYPKIVSTNKKINMIVISQPLIGEKLLKLIMELIKRLEELNLDYNIIYKLHPKEYYLTNKIKKYLSDKNVRVIGNNDFPLYKYFAISDIQIGVSSTSIYEGLAYELETYIYHIDGTDLYMGDLVKKRYASFFENSSELLELIINNTNKENKLNGEIKLWEADSLHRIVDVINQYI